MSSYPARLAKRAMQQRGYVREWRKRKGCDDAVPCRVLDADGAPFADTWTQAAVRARKEAERPRFTKRSAL